LKVYVAICKDGKTFDVFYENEVKFATYNILVINGKLTVESNGNEKPHWFGTVGFTDLIREAYENYLARSIVDDYTEQRYEFEIGRTDKIMRQHMTQSRRPAKIPPSR